MRKLQLNIPEPCHENWNAMSPTDKGKFCSACQKNVYDFTKSTDREIINAYKNDQNLCGRFLNTQLDRDLVKSKERKSIWLASAFFGMISLANTKISAQEKPKTEQTDVKIHEAGKTDTIVKHQNGEKIITGTVVDATGGIPGATIIIKGTTSGVQTNFDGTYCISAKKGDLLVFSFMGMVDVEKIIGDSNTINAVMCDDIKGGIQKKKTFLGRQFLRVRNLFR